MTGIPFRVMEVDHPDVMRAARAQRKPDEPRVEHELGWPHFSSNTGACICPCKRCMGSGGCICKACSGVGHVNCSRGVDISHTA